jgi:hypothetical protein
MIRSSDFPAREQQIDRDLTEIAQCVVEDRVADIFPRSAHWHWRRPMVARPRDERTSLKARAA